jgi:general secretion pathway protein D
VLGNLFRYRSATKTKRNLMVFLRPRILRDAASEASVSNEKYDYMRVQQLEERSARENMLRKEDHPLSAPLALPATPPPPREEPPKH